MRDYRLVRLTGWDEEQIGNQRAQWLDWILEIDELVRERESASGEWVPD